MKRTLLFMLLIGTMSACTRNEQKEVVTLDKPVLVQTKSISSVPDVTVIKNKSKKTNASHGVLKDFQSNYEPEEQVFTVDLAEPQEIVGEKGTRIFIPQGSIVSAYDQVKIHLDEAYSTIDMLKYQLTTTSNGKPIVSKGMIKLTCNDPNATINPNIPIEVKFPSNDKETACDYFIGNESKDGSINWVPQNQVTKTNALVEEKPILLYTNDNGRGLVNNIDNISKLSINEYSYEKTYRNDKILSSPINAYDIHAAFSLDTNYQYGKFAKLGYFPKNISDKIIVSVDVNVSGKLSNVVLKKGIHRSIDTIVYNAVMKSSPWVPMRQAKNSFSKSTVQVVVQVSTDAKGRLFAKRPFAMTKTSMRQVVYQEWLKMFNEYNRQSSESVDASTTKTETAVGYNFNITNFGWINCDYFPAKESKICFNLIHSKGDALKYMVVYKKEKRILNISGYGVNTVAKKPFDVVILRKKDKEFYITVSSSERIKDSELIESSKEYTMKDFEAYIQSNYN